MLLFLFQPSNSFHTWIKCTIKQAFGRSYKLHLTNNNLLSPKLKPISIPYPKLSMEKNNTPSFSICRKIRQAFASNPSFQAIHRIKQYYREPKSVVAVNTHSNSPKISHLPPQHHTKVNTQQGEGEIPIKFDYSTPESKKNGNSKVSMTQGQASKVASPQVGTSETRGKVAAKVEPLPQHVPRQGKHGIGVLQHSEQQGKKSLDFNDTMAEYIQRAKYRIRTVSNVGQGQSNYSASHEANGYGNGRSATTAANKVEVHRDQFQDFIEKTKKKIRTTSNVGKTSSFKRG